MVHEGVTTLQLDEGWQPVDQVPWMKAFYLVLEGKAEVLEHYADKLIRSVRATFTVPSVIRLLGRVSRRRGVRFSRDNVYLRDKGTCQYCGIKLGRDEFTYEHIVPRARGGVTTWTNIVVACMPCNLRKGSRSCAEAGMWPRVPAVRPKSLPGQLRIKGKIHESWRQYLADVAYWHAELEDGA